MKYLMTIILVISMNASAECPHEDMVNGLLNRSEIALSRGHRCDTIINLREAGASPSIAPISDCLPFQDGFSAMAEYMNGFKAECAASFDQYVLANKDAMADYVKFSRNVKKINRIYDKLGLHLEK